MRRTSHAAAALIATAIALAPACLAQAPDPDLLVHLKLDEGTGTAAQDASSYGNDGTVHAGAGGPAWVAGRLGDALEFYNYNGTYTRYVRVPWQPSLGITSGLTLAGWVRLRTLTTGSQTVIGRANGASDWYLQVRNRGRRIAFVLCVDGRTETLLHNLNAHSAWQVGEWHHLAATYDGSRMRLYVDGAQVRSENAPGIVTTSTSTALPIGIGAQPQTPTRWRNGIPGALDDVRLYRRALSAAEIQALANPAGAFARLRWQERL